VKVGVISWFCNMAEWAERIQPGAFDKPYPVTDTQQLEKELYLADLAEPLGFDSFWTIEHHFSPYGMTGNPTQLLTYLAGRTRRIELGTAVLVLPWHDPLKLAESISVLDNLLGGRRLNIGVGRGFAAREFERLNIPYETSRERLLEVLDIVRTALTQEYFSYEGKFWNIPRTAIRPQPRTKDLTKQMLMAWASPESLAMAAKAGLAPLYTNLGGPAALQQSAQTFNDIRAEHGWGPAPSTVSVTIYCHEDQEHAEEFGTKHWKAMTGQTVWHYDHQARADWMPDVSPEEKASILDQAYKGQIDAAIFGTPEFIIEKIRELHTAGNISHLITLNSFGDMPREDVERSMRMFASEVLPTIQSIPVRQAESVPYGQWHQTADNTVTAAR
jgi:alkanesulfonate monooxygenase SsuD/methylene tetrahydromethanopterin reductase-like flavin-dependent oxidoreductase (luciferase family)